MENRVNDDPVASDGGRRAGERRRVPRHISREERTWMGWWDGTDFHVEAVRLIDISQGGAALEAITQGPAPGDEVILRLDKSRPEECVEARVVGLSKTKSGDVLYHLAFHLGCPPHLYLSALHGLPNRGVRAN